MKSFTQRIVFSVPFTCEAADAREANGKLDAFVARTCSSAFFGGLICDKAASFTEDDGLEWPADPESGRRILEVRNCLSEASRRFLAEPILNPVGDHEI